MALYEIRVRGRLDPVGELLPGFAASEQRATTLLSGAVESPADLASALSGVQAQGLELVDLHRVSPRSTTSCAARSGAAGTPARKEGSLDHVLVLMLRVAAPALPARLEEALAELAEAGVLAVEVVSGAPPGER